MWTIEKARGRRRRNTCFNGGRAVAAVEQVELGMVELTVDAAIVVADDFWISTVGSQIRLQLSSRLIGSKHGKMTVFGPFYAFWVIWRFFVMTSC